MISFLKKDINCKEKMKKIYTTQSLSIECMLGKIGDWKSTQRTNFQQWKWKVTMCNSLDVPHKKYWVKRQHMIKWCLFSAWWFFAERRVGIGLDEGTRRALKCWIKFTFLDLDAVHIYMDVYFVINHGTGIYLYTLLYACYISNSNVYL